MNVTQEQYDERDRLTAEHGGLMEQMDGVRDHFVTRVAEELPERWGGVVRFWIANRAEEAKEPGEDGLREIWAEVIALSPEAHEIARKHLSGERVWPTKQRTLLSRRGVSGSISRRAQGDQELDACVGSAHGCRERDRPDSEGAVSG